LSSPRSGRSRAGGQNDPVPPAKDVDAFLAAVPADKRAALEKLRKTIRAAAPKATELVNGRIAENGKGR
jgi:hypothetical protein